MTGASVVICVFTQERWTDLAAAIAAVSEQSVRPVELIVVVDHNPELHTRVVAELQPVYGEWLQPLQNDGPAGVSGARNVGVSKALGDVIIFLDDDAIPEPEWLSRLVEPFSDPKVVITGGRARAQWPGERPRWFPEEFDWVVGCSYRGLPEQRSVVRNVLGASMATRRSVFETVGTFTDWVGRSSSFQMGCEETELCIRATQVLPEARIVYVPDSVVRHRVGVPRTRTSYFAKRCVAEGRSKAQISALVGADLATSSERTYVVRTLSRGVLRGFVDAVRGDASGLTRAGAIVVGLALTAAAYAWGLCEQAVTSGSAHRAAASRRTTRST